MPLSIPADAVAFAALNGYEKALKFIGKHPKHKPRKAWKKFALDFDFWRAVSPDDWRDISREHWSVSLHGEIAEIESFWQRLLASRVGIG
jgi:hypothetical protein